MSVFDLTLYKIRCKASGLYSTGGAYPDWSKHGKTYSTLSYLRSSIIAARDGSYKNAEIVQLEAKEVCHWSVEAELEEFEAKTKKQKGRYPSGQRRGAVNALA